MTMQENDIRRVGVVGAGVIGAAWTSLFLARGFDVAVASPGPGDEAGLRAMIARTWPALRELGHASGEPDLSRLSFGPAPDERFAEVQLVQENAPERLEVKRRVFAEIERVAPADALIASSTSALLIGDIQAACAHPERTLAAHPFNPPHIVPLVEISGGDLTAPEALDRATEFYRAIGKRPVRLARQAEGHIAGRLGAALWREAVHLLDQGIATVEDIDDAVRHGPGLRWAISGQHMIYHLAGGEGGMERFLDHLGASHERRWETLGAPRLNEGLNRRLVDGVREETAGRSVLALEEDRDKKLVSIIRALEAEDKKSGDV